MAKNYATLHGQVGDSVAVEQKIFVIEEAARGTLQTPLDGSFTFTLPDSSTNSTQPIESSPYKSGRHNQGVIADKIETEWTIAKYWDIDTTLGSAGLTEIDPAVRTLMKSAYGTEDTTGSLLKYTVGTPDITFSIYENGDLWAKQTAGAFVETANFDYPGDGRAQMEFAGNAKEALLVGIGESSVDNTGVNTVTVGTDEGARFPVGSKIMLLANDGVTRIDSTDTTPRNVTSVTGDVVTIDGAALTAAADGSGSPIYMAYFEPENPTAINDPQTGLQGSITIAGFSDLDCIRSMSVNLTNNHEIQDYCAGTNQLAGRLFVAGGRADVEVSIELNLNHTLIEFINGLKSFGGENIVAILGDSTDRHLKVTLPKVIFPVPAIEVPETGSIPVTFTAMANITGTGATDESTWELL